jgi:hypothetical protein
MRSMARESFAENSGLEQKVIASQSPWQNPVIERLVSAFHLESLD